MGARRLNLDAWDAWVAALRDATDVGAAQPGAAAEISVAPALDGQAQAAVARLQKWLAATALWAPCIPDAVRSEERSSAAVAQPAEARMEPACVQAALAPQKARAKSEVALAATEALV